MGRSGATQLQEQERIPIYQQLDTELVVFLVNTFGCCKDIRFDYHICSLSTFYDYSNVTRELSNEPTMI